MLNKNSNNSMAENLGLGADIIEISRFKRLHSTSPFIKRAFTKREADYCFKFKNAASHLAVTFAGKEAVLKAINSKITIPLSKIEILRDSSGVPHVTLGYEINFKIIISLSHSLKHAIAVALAIPESHNNNIALFNDKLNRIISELKPTK
jgi:phosphopantetheine--protein transferase-like protein